MTGADKPALDRFLAATEARALVVAELATRDREEALDIVQEAMLAFVKRYARKPEAEWPPLFYRVLQNKIHDWQRRGNVRRRWRVWLRTDADGPGGTDPIEALADPTGVPIEDTLGNRAAVATLVQAMGELPERQRQAVVLRIWEGLDVAATAVAMGCSAGSVKTHLSRALGKLRERLEAQS